MILLKFSITLKDENLDPTTTKMYLKTIITDCINSKENLLPISKHRYFK